MAFLYYVQDSHNKVQTQNIIAFLFLIGKALVCRGTAVVLADSDNR